MPTFESRNDALITIDAVENLTDDNISRYLKTPNSVFMATGTILGHLPETHAVTVSLPKSGIIGHLARFVYRVLPYEWVYKHAYQRFETMADITYDEDES